jgi:phage terminase large subunit-like protein
MIEQTLRSVLTDAPMPPYKKVHASRGKLTRAEPVAALYEQGKVHHVGAGRIRRPDVHLGAG